MSIESEQPPEDNQSNIPEILGRLTTAIGKMVDVVRAKPRAGLYHFSIVDEIKFTLSSRPDKANWSYRNKQSIPISLRTLTLIFDSLPSSDTYVPNMIITVGGQAVLDAHPKNVNPYRNADFQIDFKNGIELAPYAEVEIWIWNDGSDQDSKSASLFLDFGEA